MNAEQRQALVEAHLRETIPDWYNGDRAKGYSYHLMPVIDLIVAEAVREIRARDQATLARVEALHCQVKIEAWKTECSAGACDCENMCSAISYSVCGECLRVGEEASPDAYECVNDQLQFYPCPTIKALRGDT